MRDECRRLALCRVLSRGLSVRRGDRPPASKGPGGVTGAGVSERRLGFEGPDDEFFDGLFTLFSSERARFPVTRYPDDITLGQFGEFLACFLPADGMDRHAQLICVQMQCAMRAATRREPHFRIVDEYTGEGDWLLTESHGRV